MNDKSTDFPQYRKTFNGLSYYKITDETNFIEIQSIGEKRFKHTIKAEQYFEKLKVLEMLDLNSDLYLLSTENEFNRELTLSQSLS